MATGRRHVRDENAHEESVYALVEKGSKPKPKMSPPAKVPYGHHHRNHVDTIATILNPVNGYRDQLVRKGLEPKNHIAENRQRLRDESRVNKLKKETECEPSDLFKLKQFRDVDSVVAKAAEDSKPPGEGHDFVKKGTGLTAATAPKALARRPSSDAPATPKERTRPPVPKVSEQLRLAPRESKDFVQKNWQAVPETAKRVAQPKEAEAKTHAPGQVPAYLKQRKEEMEWMRQQNEKAALAAQAPPGMIALSESERVETLRVLLENKAKLVTEFEHLPLRIETQSMIKRSKELEKKMKEVDDAIVMFQRPKVYVAE